MEKNENGLLPCPFCGNKKPFLDRCASMVQCQKCWCRAPVYGKVLTPEEREGITEWQMAVRAWNKRAT